MMAGDIDIVFSLSKDHLLLYLGLFKARNAEGGYFGVFKKDMLQQTHDGQLEEIDISVSELYFVERYS